MEHKIDKSLKERHRILGLLERLNKENITVGEMEEIGKKLRKSGSRALSPLVRRLWREKSGDLISKYAYLLDFFEEDSWLQPLIRMTLTRTDLESEAKSALLAALENYGIDVSSPPFSRLLEEVGGPLRLTLPRVLAKGEQGLVIFMEDFVQYPTEMQVGMVGEFPSIGDPGVIPLLEILTGYETDEVVVEALTALGRIRLPEAAALLSRYAARERSPHRETALRSLRRLSFLGIHPPRKKRTAFFPFTAAFAGSFDGAGNRSLWMARPRSEKLRDLLFLHLHEENGLVDAVSYGGVTEEEYVSILDDVKGEERLLPVPPDYAISLLRDALHRNRERQIPLPPEYYVRQGMFADVDLTPALYAPEVSPFRPDRLELSRLVAESPLLFEEEYCVDWFIASSPVYDLADEWRLLDHPPERRGESREAQRIVERFCSDILAPLLENLSKRLLLTADLMLKSEAPRELVESALAVAETIGTGGLPHYVHPFLRRLALESLDAAAEALAEGYDLRDEGYEYED
jgi:hypothetical protein